MPANPTIRLGDLTVGRMGFGAMRITGPHLAGPPPDREGARALLRNAIEQGVTLIDTADSYGPGISEELIREALHPYKDELVIATKAGYVRGGPPEFPWAIDGNPDRLKVRCEQSLRRLGLDHIDLFQLHVVDPVVPIEDSVGALADLQQEGKIRHIGVCNVDLSQLSAARATATIVSVQNRYNLAQQDERGMLTECQREGIAFMPYSPLLDGKLTGAHADCLSEALHRIARDHLSTPGQVSLAWLMQCSPVTLPIPGTSSARHLAENMAALNVNLSAIEMAELAAASARMPPSV